MRSVKYQRWNEQGRTGDRLYSASAEGEFAFIPRNPVCLGRSHQYNQIGISTYMDECLKAQRRAASCLNIGKAELRKAQSELKWRYATDFIKAGQKRRALGLVCQNLRGAPSYRSVARNVAGLLLPKRTLRWRREFVQRRAVKCYGSLGGPADNV